MTIRPDIELANASDPGCVREVNEDYYVFIEPEQDNEFGARGRLVLVADGMGGYRGGRVASRIAGDRIRDSFLNSGEPQAEGVLREGFLSAHNAIQQRAEAEPDLENMGTTCTAVILRERHLTFGHIGDSRLYLIRDGKAKRLTRDHTVVGEMLDRALITPEEAAVHEKRHVLSAALGVGPRLEADFTSCPEALQSSDVLLLCSDGLHGVIEDHELASVVSDQSIEDACAELIAWARVRGGPDNITLQMVKVAAD